MKTDRELLELAARACGIGPVMRFQDGCLVIGPNANARYWNPLNDFGEALRLAMALEFEVNFDDIRVAVRTRNGIKILQDTDGNIDCATLRAIVRAAAAIGEKMP